MLAFLHRALPASLRRRPPLRCSFCGREEHAVARLVAGPKVLICDDCIQTCVSVLQEHGGFDMPGPNRTH
jgi:hypothetical protein